jgi:transcriptional regulator with XRE-family HTH domain
MGKRNHRDRDAPARNVRRLRLAKGWSQEQLAIEAGDLRQALISDLENGRGNQRLGTLEKVAAALGVKVADLLT